MNKMIKGKGLKRVIAILMAVALISAFIPMALATVSRENWKPGEKSDSYVKLTKEVTDRSAADTWDIEMTVSPSQKIQTPKIELALVLDYSVSMAYEGSGQNQKSVDKWSNMLTAVEDFIKGLDTTGNISVSIVKFGTTASIAKNMTPVTAQTLYPYSQFGFGGILGSFIYDNSFAFNGYTNIDDGIAKGLSTFTQNATGISQSIIVFSDGVANIYGASGSSQGGEKQAATEALNTAISASTNITFYTIGFDVPTGEAAETLLQNIAKEGGSRNGSYYASSNDAEELLEVFNQIKRLAVSMITDTVPAPFVIDGDVEVFVNGSPASPSTATVTGNTITWSPENGELGKNDKVTVNYSVKLEAIPEPDDALGDGRGNFDNMPTNEGAVLSYSVNNSATKTLRFPEPTVRFETGMVIADLAEFDTDAEDNIGALLNTVHGSPFRWTSDPVITDFEGANGVTVKDAPDSFRDGDPGTGDWNYHSTVDANSVIENGTALTGISNVTYLYTFKLDPEPASVTISKAVSGDNAPGADYEYGFEIYLDDAEEPIATFGLTAGGTTTYSFTELDITEDMTVTVKEVTYETTDYISTTVNGETGIEATLTVTDIEEALTFDFVNSYTDDEPAPVPTPPTWDPTPTPTQTPEEEPTPAPTPEAEELVIEEEPAILSDLEIPEEEVVLEEEVPLAEAPETGDTATLAITAILAVMALFGIVIVFTTTKKSNN